MFQNAHTDPEAWASFQYTTIQGGQVPESEIAQAARDLDIRTFRQEYEATFETYGNLVFYAFDRAENVRPYTTTLPRLLSIGMDFNVGQMSACVFVKTSTGAHVVDEISLPSSNTAEMATEILMRYPGHEITVYPDPAGSARKTSASVGITDHTILQNAGFTVRAPYKHNPVRDGINAVNSLLCNTATERRLFVAPGCKKTIESLSKFSYKPGTSQPDKDSGYDHQADALRYYIDYVFPVRRDSDPDQIRPSRWGHGIC